ncbi:hypothetical protein GWI33_011809 [Rhynchophorus ferrugineus]|uniref:Uncharacterized protein n=1 Tax=Rhynchophorus ferrugineus TaxID=354439 RepID=A0A834ICD5_RHYFE|nr:hypothetical protein GWI33_011809 [Rhynchophorus ferrugineus]
MNNVSWGTREVTVVANNPGSAPEVQVKKKKQSPLWLLVLKIRDFIKQFVKPPLHHVMISNMLKHVEQRFDFIKKRIKRIEDIKIDPSSEEVMQSRKSLKRGSVLMLPPIEDIQEAGEEIEENDSWDTAINGFNSNSWFYNGPLIWSQVTYLDPKEQTFWQDLLDKYLYPIEDDKAKVAKALKDLRDKIVMMFFFINSMFVLVVFLLTLQKDLVHLEWPFDAQYNFSYTNSEGSNEISVGTTYLQLEPIGFVFMIFFFGLLLIQFLCMFLHRFATYSQIMANTSLDFNFCSTEVENMTKEELLDKDPITIFRKLIRLRGVNGDEENEKEINEEVSRRSTVVNLVKNKEKVRATINDLDTAFAVRMAKIREEGNCDVPVSTDNITAINRRRTTVLRRQSQMPSNMQKVTFDVEPAPTVHFFDNNAYEDSL